jgi:hypothetical protein
MSLVLSGDGVVTGLDSLASSDLGTQLGSKLNIAGGKILQMVTATHSTEVSTTSTSFVTTNITATITPSSASNKVLVLAQVPLVKVSANIFSGAVAALFRGSVAGTQLALNEIYSDSVTGSTVTFVRIDSPNTTSAQAYTIGLKTNSGSTTVASCRSTNPDAAIVLLEVSA